MLTRYLEYPSLDVALAPLGAVQADLVAGAQSVGGQGPALGIPDGDARPSVQTRRQPRHRERNEADTALHAFLRGVYV